MTCNSTSNIKLHTHPFNGPLSGTTRVSQYQKGKTNLDFTEARDSEWQWHQLGYMQVCTSLQTDNHASTPTFNFFTARMSFLPPNQQHQSTEGSQRQLFTYTCTCKMTKLRYYSSVIVRCFTADHRCPAGVLKLTVINYCNMRC